MNTDPKKIIESETLARLAAPEPSIRDLAAGLRVIAGMMWSKEELKLFVDALIEERCKNCDHSRRVVGKRGYIGYALFVVYVIVQIVAAKLGIAIPAISQFIGG